jgi:hypothetical protein
MPTTRHRIKRSSRELDAQRVYELLRGKSTGFLKPYYTGYGQPGVVEPLNKYITAQMRHDWISNCVTLLDIWESGMPESLGPHRIMLDDFGPCCGGRPWALDNLE